MKQRAQVTSAHIACNYECKMPIYWLTDTAKLLKWHAILWRDVGKIYGGSVLVIVIPRSETPQSTLFYRDRESAHGERHLRARQPNVAKMPFN
jgi:hypothetical protein